MMSEVALFRSAQQTRGKDVLTKAQGEASVDYPVSPSVHTARSKHCTGMESQPLGTTLATKGSRTIGRVPSQNQEYHPHSKLDESEKYECGQNHAVSSRQSVRSMTSSHVIRKRQAVLGSPSDHKNLGR